MNVKLDNIFSVKRFDANNLALVEEVSRTKKDSDEKYLDDKVHGYYSTLEGALRGYHKHKVKQSDCKSLEEVIELLEIVHRTITELPESIRKMR